MVGMKAEEQVIKLTAAMIVIFEFIEALEDRYSDGKEHFDAAMRHLGDAVNGIVVDEMKVTGEIIPRPLFLHDISYDPETLYSDLGRLEDFLKELSLEVSEPHNFPVWMGLQSFSEGVTAFLLADRALSTPTRSALNPWSIINDDRGIPGA